MSGKGDSTDAWPFPINTKHKNNTIGVMPTSKDADEYNMNHRYRGKCIIFNIKTFDKLTGQKVRSGAEADKRNLDAMFKKLDFDVIIYNDSSVKEIKTVLKEVSEEDHKDRDSFACCISTHGDKNFLFAQDGRFLVSELFDPFRGHKCISLAGKPKLFFIQACRGEKFDDGMKLAANEDETDSCSMIKIPTQADFLIAYSTISDFVSFRNEDGSWFIQALCQVLNEYGRKYDLLNMLTIVSRKICFDFISNSLKPEEHEKKQIPCITSMLIRKVYFPPKNL